MPRISFSFEDLTAELDAFEKKLLVAASQLSRWQDTPPAVATPHEVVFTHGKATLWHFHALANQVKSPPVLMVYSLVNRPTMADIDPERSVIRALLTRGIDVYLIDWEAPTRFERTRGLATYIADELDSCVQFIRSSRAVDKINLLGICQGGTFSLCYSALHPDKIAGLITTVTPVDFHTSEDRLGNLLRHVDISALVETCGNVPGEWLNAAFFALKPLHVTHKKYLDWIAMADDDAATAIFFAMERWIFDSPALAGVALKEFARAFYRDNALVHGTLQISGQRIVLASLPIPILNIFARDDHIVPPAASRALRHCVGSTDYTEIELPSGHIGIYVGGKARNLLADVIAEWLAAREVLKRSRARKAPRAKL
ncbi:MAG: class III poly(R)-hydroxyalkanoic acid synthase subunit PhaC [Gammaproteobacteria bacterium]|nr:class III poly(R)-hydroxyalkanoic acid synthase subunit PhaC [Gammaproteobacteria bacterium]